MFIIKKESLKISEKLLVNFAMLVGPSSKQGGMGGVQSCSLLYWEISVATFISEVAAWVQEMTFLT
jgi:hypothetical protein